MDDNARAAAAATHPEGNGEPQKTFTQEDVNRIVQDRLAREKERAETTLKAEFDGKNAALTERENRLSCKEYVIEKGLDPRLLDILDTSNVDYFKGITDKLAEVFQLQAKKDRPPVVTASCSTRGLGLSHDLIAEAFKPKR